MLLDSRHVKMYLYNFFIENGSFMNLKKESRRLYDNLLDEKSGEYSHLSLTEYLEMVLLPHRKITNLDPRYLKYLYSHYSTKPKLYGVSIPQGFETRLKNTAQLLGIPVDEVKKRLDDNLLFPELMSQIKTRFNVRAYNSLMTALSIQIRSEIINPRNTKFDIKIINNYFDFASLEQGEPRIAELILSRIPVYGGNRSGKDDNPIITLEGSRYYGINLHLDKVLGVYDDILYALKGFVNGVNITPYASYRLKKMLKVSGNLNRIGLDSFGLIRDLDFLSLNLGFDSIKELLENEGYQFHMIPYDKVCYVPCAGHYEVFIEGYEDGQIIIDQAIKKMIDELGVSNDLQIDRLNLQGQDLQLLTYTINSKPMLAHSLLTKKNELYFASGNTLDLRAKNLVLS